VPIEGFLRLFRVSIASCVCPVDLQPTQPCSSATGHRRRPARSKLTVSHSFQQNSDSKLKKTRVSHRDTETYYLLFSSHFWSVLRFGKCEVASAVSQ
jgi:hypothetical protein